MKVLCAECLAEGEKSVVHSGSGYVTDMYSPPYYDEDGDYHRHDPNSVHMEYSCSRGHTWQSIRPLPPCKVCLQKGLIKETE